MTGNERAAQIWPVLTYAATYRQTVTYDMLGHLIGVPRMGLGKLLEPVQAYCLNRGLPALTSIVVSDVDGDPSHGFTASADIPGAQAAVYRHDWLSERVPLSDDFAAVM